MTFAFNPVTTALVALVPAAYALWRGRALSAHPDDPLLAERLHAFQRHSSVVVAVSIALLIATTPGRSVWSVPLLIVARLLAVFPLRKAVHNETWSVTRYLSFYLRLMAAAFGFWLLVAAAPAIIALAGTSDWIVAIVIGAIAVAWNAKYATVFGAILRSEPVDAAEIRSRFAQMVQECGLRNVALEQVRMKGGSFINAVALPSIHTPAVLVTDTLLTRLDEDEILAILAHELAHHEHYNPRRLRRMRVVTYLLITAAVALPPAMRVVAPDFLRGLTIFWPLAVIVYMLVHAQHRQKHETESDLRAAALTRNPDALARALTKLHVLAHVPRRLDTEFERRSTHPSLSRRIQAIRTASDAALPSLTDPVVISGVSQEASVTFYADRLEWHEGSSTTHAIHYGSLRELRIDVRRSAAPELVAIDSAARRWTLPLQATDLARAQSVLDVVDVHLGKSRAPAVLPINGSRFASVMAMIASLALGQWAVLITGLLALLRPRPEIALSAGVSALAASWLAWRSEPSWELSDVWLPITLGLSGIALIARALADRRDRSGEADGRLLAIVGIAAAMGWIVIALFSASALHVHRNLRDWPSAIVLTCAFAGGLAFAQSRGARVASAPIALAGLFAVYAVSPSFVDRFVDDLFVAPAPPTRLTTETTSPIREFSVDLVPSSLLLSPAGEYIALTAEDSDEQISIHAGRSGTSLVPFMADEAAFIGESQLLLLERQSRASTLRLVELADRNRTSWTLSVPIRSADLSVNRSSREWRLLGHGPGGDIVSAEGVIGEQTLRESRWKTPNGDHHVRPLAVSNRRVIALETRYADSGPDITGMLSLPILWSLHRSRSLLWSLTDQGSTLIGESNADVSCHTSQAVDDVPICAAFDGTRTRFFAPATDAQVFTAQAFVTGEVYASGMDDGGWLKAWWNRTAVALRPATNEAIALSSHAGEQPYQIAVATSAVAALFSSDGPSTIRIHPASHKSISTSASIPRPRRIND